MSKIGLLGDALGQLGDLGKQTGKSLVQSSGDLAKTAARQIGAAPSPEASAEQFPPKADQPLAEKAKEQAPQQAQQAQEALRQHQTKEVVASLYAPTEKPAVKTPLAQTAQHIAEAHPEKAPEEVQKEAQAAVELHKTTYYDPLVTLPQQPEEKPAEKVEREKMEDLQEKQKKDQDRANKDASVEQAQNVEKHRGAAG